MKITLPDVDLNVPQNYLKRCIYLNLHLYLPDYGSTQNYRTMTPWNHSTSISFVDSKLCNHFWQWPLYNCCEIAEIASISNYLSEFSPSEDNDGKHQYSVTLWKYKEKQGACDTCHVTLHQVDFLSPFNFGGDCYSCFCYGGKTKSTQLEFYKNDARLMGCNVT